MRIVARKWKRPSRFRIALYMVGKGTSLLHPNASTLGTTRKNMAMNVYRT